MALFGSRRQALGIVPFMDEEPAYGAQKMPAAFNGPPAKRARRGLFGGGVSRLLGNDGNPATPNLWDWIALGPQAPDILQDRQQRQQLFGARMSATKREEEEALRQQAAREAAYAALPEQLRPLGPILTPEAISRAVMPPPPEPPDWDLDPVTGQPYTVTPQGRVQYGEGRVNVRPAGGSGERAPPAGYRWTPDGNMEAVPGGPADLRAGQSAQRARRAYETAIRNRQNVLTSIHRARELSNRSGTTGLAGQVFGGMGGTPAHDLQSEVETIVANIGFEALQEMRANSETGGALGQVAVREIDLLQATIASLRTSQSRAQFQRNLNRVEQQYNRTLQAYQAALGELGGPAPQQQPDAAPQRPPNVPAEARWDAQRQRWVAD